MKRQSRQSMMPEFISHTRGIGMTYHMYQDTSQTPYLSNLKDDMRATLIKQML